MKSIIKYYYKSTKDIYFSLFFPKHDLDNPPESCLDSYIGSNISKVKVSNNQTMTIEIHTFKHLGDNIYGVAANYSGIINIIIDVKYASRC